MRKKLVSLLLLSGMILSSAACGVATEDSNSKGTEGNETDEDGTTELTSQMIEINHQTPMVELNDKYGTTYEIFVRSFYDSDGDGIGDLKGVTEKLDYLNDGDPETSDDLGVDGIWLMPIMSSTTYHKYDVTDYYDIDSEYGTLEDFDELISEAHKRGLKIYLDLVLNHTSSQHPWFQEAKEFLSSLPSDGTAEININTTECPYVEYYNFTKYPSGGSYGQLADTDWYYECPFWSEMPDLNLDNEAVRGEISEITQFWIDRGVDGFRLDAIKEYTSNNTEANVETLQWFMDLVRSQKSDIYVVGEAWTDSLTYTRYYESGIDSCFDFDFADKTGYLTRLAKGELKATNYVSKSNEILELIQSNNPDGVNAPFFVNHDLGRAAGYFAGDEKEKQIKLAWAMNFFETGNAFLYYGEEIGMKGSGKDENKRMPMQWSASGEGMTTAPADADDVEMPFGTLEEQLENPYSIYSYVREAVQLRSRFPVLARGTMTSIDELSTDQVAVFWKQMPSAWMDEGATVVTDQDVIICMNLSSHENEVDLSHLFDTADLAYPIHFELGGVLTVDDQEIILENEKVNLPAYACAIIVLRADE